MPNCWSTIFPVLPKIDGMMDVKLIWQILEDTLISECLKNRSDVASLSLPSAALP
jgi:hypothetical protein